MIVLNSRQYGSSHRTTKTFAPTITIITRTFNTTFQNILNIIIKSLKIKVIIFVTFYFSSGRDRMKHLSENDYSLFWSLSMRVFKYKRGSLEGLTRPVLCAIVNVTPDSFSDGGKWINPEKAVGHALELIAEGAGMIDIGGESTRPGSNPVSIDEEMARVLPVIRALRARTSVPISIDTWKAEVAGAALDAGADIVNDITGLLGDEYMASTIASKRAGLIAMFNPVMARPEHEGSKIFPKFGNAEVFTDKDYRAMASMSILELMDYFFDKTLKRAAEAGLDPEHIMLDPGIGFGLTKKENLELVDELSHIHRKGFMAFLGLSRKRFVVNLLEENGFNVDFSTEEGRANRDLASSYLSCLAAQKGAEVLRVHTIKEHKMGLVLAEALNQRAKFEDKNFVSYNRLDR